jgi:hypothetical protein
MSSRGKWMDIRCNLVDQVVRNSNALQTMAGMLLAIYGSSADAGHEMRKIQWQFADCLPTLLPVAAS